MRVCKSTNKKFRPMAKHGFSCVNICQVIWKILTKEGKPRGFQHLQRDVANVNALKKQCLIVIIA